MSLPFADKPEASSIYQDLKSLVLSDLTADQFDELRDRIFSEGVNGTEDEFRRLVLLGQASQKISSSGPIPGTGLVTDTDQTDQNIIVIKEPAKGEVWCVTGGSVTGTSLSGTVCYHLLTANQSDSIAGSTDRSKACLQVEVCGTAGQQPLNETVPFGAIYIDDKVGLYAQGTGTFTSLAWKITMFRVR
jgi:hypothetical protein